MKKLLKQIAKAAGYFAVYITTSNFISLIVSSVISFRRAAEYTAAGLSREEGMALVQSEFNSMTGICLMAGAILTLLIYAIVEKVKKTSIFKEADIKKVSAKQMILTIVGALGGMFFMNFILNLLPIPQELTGGLQTGMSQLTSYPFWQAMLANALLVPIMEEVVFRGYLFNRLGKAMPAAVAAIVTSVIFGLCHGGLLWATWAGVMGLLVCVVRIKSGSILPGIVFHIIMNAFGMIVSYFPVLSNLTKGGMIALTVAGGILLAVYVAGILMDKGQKVKKDQAEVVITSTKA